MKTFKKFISEALPQFNVEQSMALELAGKLKESMKDKVAIFITLPPKGGKAIDISYALDEKGKFKRATTQSERNYIRLVSTPKGWRSQKPSAKKTGTTKDGENHFKPGKTFTDEQVLAFLKTIK